MSVRTGHERLAVRLLAAYPPGWRERYGEEFVRLLLDQLDERAPTPAGVANVVGHGMWTRLGELGAVGDWALPDRRRRTARLLLLIAGSLSALCAAAMWAQLAVGWQWSAPASAPTRVGMQAMTVGLLGVGVSVLLASIPVLAAVFRALVRRRPCPHGRVLLVVLAVVGLGFGGAHVAAAWPGTGGQPWPGRTLAPAWPARMAWALTLSLSSYWAHPGELARLGDRLMVWMVVSPCLIAVMVWNGCRVLSWIRLAPRALRFIRAAARIGVLSVAVFLIGALCWAADGSSGPHGLFVAGAIDTGLLVATTAGLLGVLHALRRLGGQASAHSAGGHGSSTA
jgi:hypothetical protein